MDLTQELAEVEVKMKQLHQEHAELQQATQAKLQEIIEKQGVHKWLSAKIAAAGAPEGNPPETIGGHNGFA